MKQEGTSTESILKQIAREAASSSLNIYSLLKELADNINEVLWLKSHDRFLYVSPAYEAIWGRSCQSLYQSPESFLESIHPEDRERIIQAFQERAVKKIGYIREEYRIIRPDGTLRWILSKTFPVHDEKGQVQFSAGIAEDITERKLVEETLWYRSLHDALTDLYNRAYFQEEMQRLDNMRDNPVGLLIIDMDGLKTVNDSLGHLMGDKLIQDVAKLLRSCFRKSDVVARIGGDEFAVLLPRTSAEAVLASSKRIQAKVVEYNAQNEINMGLSIGQAIRLDASKTMLELFKEADDKMYANKPDGRR
ncbi:sensor domain-containing diguanylate cyclase [Desulforamulus aeronauticus]|uniref:PAS domain S-box-containing protein/diguanylate cyclase (GGDEF) domain-containing protein n=1 Tax=Desulforamulus aeronauticus DSM 10349 TaxID=1121421 RepID=A0A1M6NZU4_9FIRM|nr:sensor domain-containing diguanylate cyclase [Desulforamulus aeronauticus]SHK01152.1 PAS domain S-box-containing protein/diguanylate cyclase (GGDEF) domain-containing protein [Desulforamulus aeronauticus DSM 10349]